MIIHFRQEATIKVTYVYNKTHKYIEVFINNTKDIHKREIIRIISLLHLTPSKIMAKWKKGKCTEINEIILRASFENVQERQIESKGALVILSDP